MAEIHIIPVFNNKSLSAGDVGTSQIIDLRNIAQRGDFALAFSVAKGTAGTAGTTAFSYAVSSLRGGTYVAPSASVGIGTAGTDVTQDIATFTPVLAPFMKIIATQVGAGTQGYDSKVTAELIVR